MVKWINAQNPDSSIGNAIAAAAQTMYGDTLTPALKREQLRKAQRENAGVEGLMSAFGALGNAGAGYTRPGAPGAPTGGGRGGGRKPVFAEPVTSGMLGDPSGDLGFGLPSAVPAGAGPVKYGYVGRDGFKQGVIDTATALGADPVELATIMSYETGGTLDPQQPGPRTQYGQHEGLIQFGEPQAAQYGADFSNQYDALNSQLGPDGAVAKYFEDNGYQPGMDLLDMYSIVNAGAPGRYNASDAGNGGAPGTVTDKVAGMGGHAANMAEMFGGQYLPGATDTPMIGAPATGSGEYNPLNAGQMYGELAKRTIEAGGDPQKTAEMARMMMAGMFGAENQATTDAFVGAGGSYDNTYSGFSADQNRQERDSVRDSATTQRGQDMSYDLGVYKDSNEMVKVIRDGTPMEVRKEDMLPTDQAVISDSENKGLVARGMDMTPAQMEAYVGADATKDRKATWVRTPEGTTVPTIDGRTNANTGEVLPNGTLPVSGSGSMSDLGLDKLNARDAQAQVLAGKQFKGTLARARDVATKAGPTAFGIIGRARSLGQDVQAAVNAGAEAFGGGIEQSVKQTEASLRDMAASDPVAASFFNSQYDPNLTSLEMYARLLPYEAAMAIAGQEGRGLSDSDVKRFQAIVGDPLSFFGSQQAFLTTLDMIEAETDARISANQKALTEGKSGVLEPVAPGTPASQGAEPKQITSDAEYDSLPSGTEFIAPDGSRRRKP